LSQNSSSFLRSSTPKTAESEFSLQKIDVEPWFFFGGTKIFMGVLPLTNNTADDFWWKSVEPLGSRVKRKKTQNGPLKHKTYCDQRRLYTKYCVEISNSNSALLRKSCRRQTWVRQTQTLRHTADQLASPYRTQNKLHACTCAALAVISDTRTLWDHTTSTGLVPVRLSVVWQPYQIEVTSRIVKVHIKFTKRLPGLKNFTYTTSAWLLHISTPSKWGTTSVWLGNALHK